MKGAILDEPVRDVAGKTAAGPPSKRGARLALAGVIALHILLCVAARPPGFLTGQDDVEYAALGQSLRHGGYNMLFRVDAPIHAQYPPGYPAMLAAWGGIFGDGFASLSLLTALMSGALIGLVYVAVRRIADWRIALLACALLAVNPALVQAGGQIASETPYALVATLALVLLMREGRMPLVAAGAVAILAALTRSIGVVLVGAVALHWLMEKRWKAVAIFTAVSIVTVGAWLAWTAIAPEQYYGMSYIADLNAAVGQGVMSLPFLRRVSRRVMFYAAQGLPVTLALPAIQGTIVDNIATGLAMIAGLIAGLIVYARKWRPAALYLVLYFGLLVVWAWRTDRFIVPLAPILVPAMLLGCVALARRLSVRAPWVGAALVAVLLLAGSALRTTALVAKGLHCRSSDGWPPSECLNRHAASFFEAMRYIEAEVPSDAIFLTAKSGALWSYTGHRSVSYGAAIAQEPGGFVPFLEEAGVEWILLAYLEQSEPGGLANQLEHNCSALSLVAHFPEQTYLFRRVDPESNTGADDACKAVMSYRAKSSGDVGEEVQTTGGRR